MAARGLLPVQILPSAAMPSLPHLEAAIIGKRDSRRGLKRHRRQPDSRLYGPRIHRAKKEK